MKERQENSVRRLLKGLPSEGIAIHGTSSFKLTQINKSGYIDSNKDPGRTTNGTFYFVLRANSEFPDMENTIFKSYACLVEAQKIANRKKLHEIEQFDDNHPIILAFIPNEARTTNLDGFPQVEMTHKPTPSNRIIGEIDCGDKTRKQIAFELLKITRRYIRENGPFEYLESNQEAYPFPIRSSI